MSNKRKYLWNFINFSFSLYHALRENTATPPAAYSGGCHLSFKFSSTRPHDSNLLKRTKRLMMRCSSLRVRTILLTLMTLMTLMAMIKQQLSCHFNVIVGFLRYFYTLILSLFLLLAGRNALVISSWRAGGFFPVLWVTQLEENRDQIEPDRAGPADMRRHDKVTKNSVKAWQPSLTFSTFINEKRKCFFTPFSLDSFVCLFSSVAAGERVGMGTFGRRWVITLCRQGELSTTITLRRR